MATCLQIQLTRLSKMFQQSARIAIETTVLSPDVQCIVVSPSPHVACLPRWSSAPASLAVGVDRAAGTDEPDTVAVSPTYVEPGVRQKLTQMFSLDVGMLERAPQHQQPAGDDRATTTHL